MQTPHYFGMRCDRAILAELEFDRPRARYLLCRTVARGLCSGAVSDRPTRAFESCVDDVSLFAFGYLFGFVGLLIAGPLAAAIGVLMRIALRQYYASPLYARPVPATPLREIDGAGIPGE